MSPQALQTRKHIFVLCKFHLYLRVSCLPTAHGESVVMRILDQSATSLDLENVGLPEDVYEQITMDIEKPNGIFIVTGPTGSGKTTTLYSILRRINQIDTKLLTAEEPVEYDVDGIVQVPINHEVGNTFPKVLRAFLRQDPDIMLIGEAPGEQESLQGRPFVGKAGKNLDGFLQVLELNREDIYISNVVKVRPTKVSPRGSVSNRPPNPEELALFTPFLMEEILLVQPEMIVTL